MLKRNVASGFALVAALVLSLAPVRARAQEHLSLEEVIDCWSKSLPPSAHGGFTLTWKSGKGEERKIEGYYWAEQPKDAGRNVIIASKGEAGGKPAAYLIREGDEIGEVWVATPQAPTAKKVIARGEAGELYGTDITFEDFARFARMLFPGQLRRLDDAVVEGRQTYVVQTRPAPDEGSEYSNIVSALDKEWCVVLRRECFETSYEGGKVARKVITSDPKAVKHEQGYARATRAVMTDAKDGSETHVELVDLTLDAKLIPEFFAPEKLAEKLK
jgi:hypothetical protein